MSRYCEVLPPPPLMPMAPMAAATAAPMPSFDSYSVESSVINMQQSERLVQKAMNRSKASK